MRRERLESDHGGNDGHQVFRSHLGVRLVFDTRKIYPFSTGPAITNFEATRVAPDPQDGERHAAMTARPQPLASGRADPDPPAQTPPAHTSPLVHGLPSSQATALGVWVQ